ncbi:hypothetical protein FH972_022756 [Carpinus fangiana]|uniref:Uncharacterized protein n=1 Tax=Carpinus fangiana TaxID=176857 RepID=A0A5N6KTU9_9ROSI|nr:hypothetical protein FH972_022756 [Carpinus fangiana]
MAHANEHPTTDDSEAETDIITPMKPKVARNGSHDDDGSRLNGRSTKSEFNEPASPSAIGSRKRKASIAASSGSRQASRTGSLSSDVDASAKKARISSETDSSSDDDGEGSDINIGRARSRMTSARRNGRSARSERDSASRTQSPNESHSHTHSHRRSTSLHASAITNVTDREKRARKRVASHEVTDQDSPIPPVPRKKADRSGRTPFARACDDGDEDKVTTLLHDIGADLDQTDFAGNTPLQFACNGGFVGIVKMLLDAGAKMDTCNVDGESPWKDAEDGLKRARAEDDAEEDVDSYTQILDSLRAAGYDPNKHSREFQKQYPKHRAHFISYKPADLLRYVKDRDIDSVEKVLDAGVRPSTEALVAACNAGDHDIFSRLVAKGMETDLNCCYPSAKKLKGGDTPMAAALNKGAFDTVEYLCNAPGYDPLQTVQGVPYYKLAGKREGTSWPKMRARLREDYVNAKRDKGQEVEMSEAEEVPPAAEEQEAETETKYEEDEAIEQMAEENADVDKVEEAENQIEQRDAHAESKESANHTGQATVEKDDHDQKSDTAQPKTLVEPQDTSMADSDGPVEPQENIGVRPKDSDGDEQMFEEAAHSEIVAPESTDKPEEVPTDKPVDSPSEGDAIMKDEAADLQPEAASVEEIAPREPTPPPAEVVIPEPALPRAIESALRQGKSMPLLRPRDKPWLKALADYNTVYAVRLAEFEPGCAASDAETLMMMGWQASIILGHASLADMAKSTALTRPMTVAQREALWQRNPALRSWLNRDAFWEEAPPEVLATCGVPYDVDDDFVQLVVAERPDLAEMSIAYDGSMRVGAAKALKTVERTVFRGGKEVPG